MVTIVLLLRRALGPKVGEGTLHPNSFRVLAVSKGNAISWRWAFWKSGGGAFIVISRQWHPTPVLLPGKSHGRRSLVGCSPWGRKESDTTERLN